MKANNLRRATPSFPICFLVILGSALFAPPVEAQVFDLGPSDSALFGNVFNLPGDTFNPFAPGSTQLNVSSGASIGGGGLSLSGTELNVSGGNVGGGGFVVSNSEVNVSGGNVGSGGFTVLSGSVVNVSGGQAGSGGFFVALGGVANVVDGDAGSGGFVVQSGGVANISGGDAGSGGFTIESGGVANISGGTIGSGGTSIESGSEINFFGSEFFVQGVAVSLTNNDFLTIQDRNTTLSGTLLDGSLISVSLGTDQDTTFNVSAIPEPSSLAVLSLGGFILLGRRRRAGC